MSKVLFKKGEPLLAIVYALEDIKDGKEPTAEVENSLGEPATFCLNDLLPLNNEIRKSILANKIKLLEQEWASLSETDSSLKG